MSAKKAAWLYSHGAAESTLLRATLEDGRELWITHMHGDAYLVLELNRDDYIPQVEAQPDIRW